MKKKIIILITLTIILLIGIISFVIWNNRTVSTITIDINPSLEIRLNKSNIVKSIIPLNDDAKSIINKSMQGKKLDNTLKLLTDNAIEEGYIDEQVDILIHSEGIITNNEVQNKLISTLDKKNIAANIIKVDTITKEDKALSKKYNISVSKAAYINQVTKENQNIDVSYLVEKSVNELEETKNRGVYCQQDYTLEGDFCLKEIGREKTETGKVCPKGYYEYQDKCYEEVGSEEGEKLVCNEGFVLKNEKCYHEESIMAEPVKYECAKGEAKTRLELKLSSPNDGDAKEIVCVDYSNATHPVSPCEANDGTEYTYANGKCYWHRAPVIAEGCPGKVQVNGECWDDATGIYICVGYRDGTRYSSKDEYCENSITYTDPIVTEYKCPKEYTLNNNKCEKQEIEETHHERLCPSGYTMIEQGRCINKNKTVSKEDGYVCNQENSRLKGNECIIYEIIEASHN